LREHVEHRQVVVRLDRVVHPVRPGGERIVEGAPVAFEGGA
jgi:hypothetical protein